MITNKASKIAKAVAIGILLGLTFWGGYYTCKVTHKAPSTQCSDGNTQGVPEVALTETTGVSATTKTNATDPDVVVNQTYTAKVNGQIVTVPIKEVSSPQKDNASGTSKASTQGVQGTIKQEIDLTHVIDLAVKANEKKWSIGTGLGTEQGNVYVPVELRKDFSKDKAAAIAIHLNPKDNFKISGGEVKYYYKF